MTKYSRKMLTSRFWNVSYSFGQHSTIFILVEAVTSSNINMEYKYLYSEGSVRGVQIFKF